MTCWYKGAEVEGWLSRRSNMDAYSRRKKDVTAIAIILQVKYSSYMEATVVLNIYVLRYVN